MRNAVRLSGIITAVVVIMGPLSVAPRADTVSDFFTGKQIAIEIGSDAGGGYDLYARLVARHIGRHIPGNPSIVPKNMPGAGSLKVANFIYNQAPKDGTEIGAPQNGVVFEKIFHTLSKNGENALFDATKFNWLGSANESVYVLVAWHTSPVKKFTDLYTQELIVGAPASSTDNYIQAVMLNRMFGTKLKIVTGYSGSGAVGLAMERGELAGSAGNDWSTITSAKPQWLTEKQINILLQLGLTSRPALAGVPSAIEIAKSDEDRKVLELVFAKYGMSRPFMAPPGVPPDRAKALRAAFEVTMKDPVMLAEAEKQNMEINAVTGEQVDALVKKIFDAPGSLAARARSVVKE